MISYLRNDLGYEVDLKYEVSAKVSPWKDAPDLNLLEELRSAMAQNPYLRVLVADGYYDKLYFWPEFTFSQFDFNPELRSRVRIATYEGGPHDVHPQGLAGEDEGRYCGIHPRSATGVDVTVGSRLVIWSFNRQRDFFSAADPPERRSR